MGRKRRIPSLERCIGGRAVDVVEYLARNGFAAEIVRMQ
jgi:hypothetical protein